jgi:hypothetical protein
LSCINSVKQIFSFSIEKLLLLFGLLCEKERTTSRKKIKKKKKV